MVDYELNELRREFLDEAREKVQEMQSALERAQDREALERLAYLAHQLKGSGGSYGYQRISDDAARLELAIETGKNGDGTSELARCVGSLRIEIDKAAMELG